MMTMNAELGRDVRQESSGLFSVTLRVFVEGMDETTAPNRSIPLPCLYQSAGEPHFVCVSV
jgi:hypothetical protein